jgi:hypothetical protein
MFKAIFTTASAWALIGTMALALGAQDLASIEAKLDQAEAAMARSERAGVNQSALERELDDLRDEVAYMRVKTRRGERVSEKDRADLDSRITRFTSRLGQQAGEGRNPHELPVGTELDVRLQTPLTSNTAQVEDRVEATTLVHLYKGDQVLVPAGAVLSGYVTSVDRASRTDRKGSLTIQFRSLRADNRSHDILGSVVGALESEGLKGEAGRIGAGAGVGAILGGIFGGMKGAIAGILIGGGGAVVATEGKDVELPVGTVLRVRLDSTVTLD